MTTGLKPLSRVAEDSTVRIVSADCGRGLCARLASMGLRPGARLRVVKSVGPGPLVVAIGQSRLGLGRGVADKILVASEDVV
jgi:ferrous iron transport protein A